jgi:hypothetical protein
MQYRVWVGNIVIIEISFEMFSFHKFSIVHCFTVMNYNSMQVQSNQKTDFMFDQNLECWKQRGN